MHDQMIAYTDSLDGISSDRLGGFFEGWPNPPSAETHLRILRGSDEVVLAIDKGSGDVVGFATAITDGALSAFVPLLEVLPAYRGQGIGWELVRRMLGKLDAFYSIDLACDEGTVSFYERLGMRPGVRMSLRNYDRQAGEASP